MTCIVVLSDVAPKSKIISIVMLVKDYTQCGLKASKELVERVLLRESVELVLANTETAKRFIEEANKLGANAALKNEI